jgi:hypothetical protein
MLKKSASTREVEVQPTFAGLLPDTNQQSSFSTKFEHPMKEGNGHTEQH